MSCLEFLELCKSRLNSSVVELGLEGAVVEVGLSAVAFELQEGHEGGEDVVALGVGQLGGRLSQGCVLLEGLVVLLDFPPFLVDREERRRRKRHVART